jgi:3-oxoacyl-[acyl-carrier-protein] synthase-1
MSKVVITGIGIISSIGNDVAQATESLKNLKHGFALYPPFEPENVPVKIVGTIKDFDTTSTDQEDWTYPANYKVKREVMRGLAPHGLYAYCATQQAINDSGLTPEQLANPDTGIYTASGGSPFLLHRNMARMHQYGVNRCPPLAIVSSIAGTLTFNLDAAFGIQGYSCGFVSACASSGHALGFAMDAIRLGRQKRMIVVGGEDGNLESILPFAGMRALSPSTDPDTASRPFDRDRNGFVGTGGGVTLVLEDEASALGRKATIYGELAGWGQSSDGHNVAISHPDGDGLARAMKMALNDARVNPDQVDYLNAHAPSTPIGDRSEIRAIRQVFKTGTTPAISSTKAITGHALSMASILEVALSLLAMKGGFMPGSANLVNIDPEAAGLPILKKTRPKPPSLILSNSSGFGGANVALVLRSYR